MELQDNIKDPFKIGKYKMNILKTELYNDDIDFEIEDYFKKLYDQASDSVSHPFFSYFDDVNERIIHILSDDFFLYHLDIILSKLNVKYTLVDITDDFLNLNYKLDMKYDKNTNGISSYKEFMEKTGDFKLYFITVDKVLDKISRSGMESLEKDEKDFLLKS